MNAITFAAGFSVLNFLLLGVLTVVWLRNYRRFRTPLVLALVVFALVMLAENATAIYFVFFSMGDFYAMDATVQNVMASLRGLQFLALCFLTWATLQ